MGWLEKYGDGGKIDPKNPMGSLPRANYVAADNTRTLIAPKTTVADQEIILNNVKTNSLVDKKNTAKRVKERNEAAKAIDSGEAIDFWEHPRESLYQKGQALGVRARIFPEEESIIDVINPLTWIPNLAEKFAKAPLEAKQSDSNLPYVTALGEALLMGRMMGSNSINPVSNKFWTNTNTNKQFINNLGAGVPGLVEQGVNKLAQSTESGILSNTYKLNPWAFKPNPEAYYHRSPNLENIIMDDKLVGFGTTVEGKLLNKQAKQTYGADVINLTKAANIEPYFSKGVPLDWGRYNKPNTNLVGKAGQMAQGYSGPYLAEATNIPFVAKADGKFTKVWNTDGTFKRGVAPNEVGTYATPIEGNVPLDNLKFYKEDWLRGYKEIPKPTQQTLEVPINSNNFPASYINKNKTPLSQEMQPTLTEVPELSAEDKIWQSFGIKPKNIESSETKEYGGKINNNWLNKY